MTSNAANRQMPYSEESEVGLLGSILQDSTRALHVSMQSNIDPTDFYVVAHQTVYDAMLELHRRGRPVDLVSITHELKKDDRYDRIGGTSFLTSLIDNAPTPAHAQYYAGIVRSKSERRAIIHACHDGAARAYSDEDETQDLLSSIQSELFSISKMQEGLTENVDAIRKNMDRWKDAASGSPHGLECYLESVKHLTGRYRHGKPYFVGATPGAGKSTILINQFMRWALEGIPVAINSIEMDHEECIARVLCDLAGVSLYALDHGTKEREGEKPRLKKAWEAATTVVDPETGRNLIPLWINDRTMTVDQLWAWARFMVERHQVQAVGVDYLQILRPPKSYRGTRREAVIEVITSLREMAKELKIVLYILSQLSKEGRGERRPRPSDMKESSDIEDIAEQIVMLYEWPKMDKNPKTGKMEPIRDRNGKPIMEFIFDVQKNRRGLLGERVVFFNKREHRIEDYIPDEDEMPDAPEDLDPPETQEQLL